MLVGCGSKSCDIGSGNDRNSLGVETCNSRSMLVNIDFFFLWRAKAQYSDLLFLFLNFYAVLRRAERDEMRKIKFEATQIHFFK